MDARTAPAPAPDDVLGPLGARVPFRVHDRPVTCAEALGTLAVRGTWPDVVHEVGLGEQALAAADAAARAALEVGLPAAETALRRRLRITAADDYLAWLDQHGLTVADCRDHLRRRLALAAAGSGAAAPPDPTAVRAHVVIEGVLDSAVRRLAEDAAIADVDPADPDWLTRVVQASDAVRAAPADPDEVAAVIVERTVDWTRVEGAVAVVPDDDVAHELLLCVREQHAPLAQVAESVGVPTSPLRSTLDSLEPWLEPVLLGAEPGALLGPVAHPAGRAVVEVTARAHPGPQDEQSRQLATEVLLERRIATALSSAVRWSADA
ncbi:MAG: hypothetical protein U0R76_00875 [Candidatus Nanopelagicales bacterium]